MNNLDNGLTQKIQFVNPDIFWSARIGRQVERFPVSRRPRNNESSWVTGLSDELYDAEGVESRHRLETHPS